MFNLSSSESVVTILREGWREDSKAFLQGPGEAFRKHGPGKGVHAASPGLFYKNNCWSRGYHFCFALRKNWELLTLEQQGTDRSPRAWLLGACEVTPSTDALNGLVYTESFLLQKCLVAPITCSCTESIFQFCYVPGTVLGAKKNNREQNQTDSLL